MSAVHRGLDWTTRQTVVLLATVMAVAVLGGGVGGYMIRGGSTPVVTRVIPASQARDPGVTGPLTEPHDAIPTQGPSRDSQSGYGAAPLGAAGHDGLHGDSASGY